MATVFSSLKHSDNVGLSADGQQQTRQNRQIYSEIFSDKNTGLSVSDSLLNTDADFDLSDILKRAVNTEREKRTSDKNPCSICYKNVNKNQKAIFCSI